MNKDTTDGAVKAATKAAWNQQFIGWNDRHKYGSQQWKYKSFWKRTCLACPGETQFGLCGLVFSKPIFDKLIMDQE